MKGNKPFLALNYTAVQIIGLGREGEAFEAVKTLQVFIWTMLGDH